MRGNGTEFGTGRLGVARNGRSWDGPEVRGRYRVERSGIRDSLRVDVWTVAPNMLPSRTMTRRDG